MRLEEFKQPLEGTLKKEVDADLWEARRTVLEHDFVQGCIVSVSSPAEAKPRLNATIGMMSAGGNMQTTDVHVGLWAFVSKVIGGADIRS